VEKRPVGMIYSAPFYGVGFRSV